MYTSQDYLTRSSNAAEVLLVLTVIAIGLILLYGLAVFLRFLIDTTTIHKQKEKYNSNMRTCVDAAKAVEPEYITPETLRRQRLLELIHELIGRIENEDRSYLLDNSPMLPVPRPFVNNNEHDAY